MPDFSGKAISVITHTLILFRRDGNYPDRALREYSRSHIFRRDEADYKECVAEEITPKQYQIWHRKEVQEFQ